jgi:hypothetical protein
VQAFRGDVRGVQVPTGLLRGLEAKVGIPRPKVHRFFGIEIRGLFRDVRIEPAYRAVDSRAPVAGGWWDREAWLPVADLAASLSPAWPWGGIFAPRGKYEEKTPHPGPLPASGAREEEDNKGGAA